MSSTSVRDESSDPMDITPEAREFYEWLEGALLGIKDQVQKLCRRMDRIMPPLEEQNQQLEEGMAESQIITESREN